MPWYQQLLPLCLYMLIQMPLHTLADAFRCYSCTWNAFPEEGYPGQQPCRSADDIRVIPSDSNNFISEPECIKCMKSEIWAGGELQSVMRSCIPLNSEMYAKEPGCIQEERRSQILTSCYCDGDLCNRAGSLGSRHDLWTCVVMGLLVSLHLLIR